MTIKTPVYLDYHATTPCDPAVVEAMLPYFGIAAFGNPNAVIHKNGRNAAKSLAGAKEHIAALIGAVPEAITLASGATEANNIAILGTAAANNSGRNEILISAIEHDSVTKPAQHLVEQGYALRIIPSTKDGFIDPETVAGMVGDKTLLVSVSAANHEIGTIQPIRKIAEISHAAGALFHSDATQAAGKFSINVADGDIDLLSFSGHKIYGPSGIGVLYARPRPPVPVSSILYGGSQQKLRSGTVPLALAVGLGEACRIAGERMMADTQIMNAMTREMLDILTQAVPSLTINGALHHRLPGSLNFFIPGIAAEDILLDLADELCLSTGAACCLGTGAPSSVLSAIGLTPHEISGSIRLSFGRMTTREEMLFAAKKIIQAGQVPRLQEHSMNHLQSHFSC